MLRCYNEGARVDYDNGKVLKLAVSQADVTTLRLLCSAGPSTKNKSSAIPLIFGTNGSRHSSTVAMLELLLMGGVEEGSAMQALNTAIKGGLNNLDIVERLIVADARLIGHAFDCAISLSNAQQKEGILKFLLSKGISQETLDQALLAESRQIATTNNKAVIQLLIQHDASISHNNGEAFINCTTTIDASLVNLLLNSWDTPPRDTITAAFRSLFATPNLRRLHTPVTEADRASDARRSLNISSAGPAHNTLSTNRSVNGVVSGDCLEIANELLSRGVDQNAIDLALRTVLDPENGLNDVDLIVDLLLSHRADVNTANGSCFVFAARHNLVLFTKLLAYQPNFTTLVPSLINSSLGEETLLQCIESCFNHGCTADDLDLSHPPSLILAVQKYPRSESLAKLLLTHGCNPDASVSGVIDSESGEESMQALLWALAQPQKLVSSPVIHALLQAGASATRTTPVSETAAIALAAREGRSDIVKTLLDHGVDASIRDKWDRSALFYASSASNTSVVEILASHAMINDGSLHEAARSLQLDAAALLIKSGHTPNFPSRLHEGRNPLGEMCLNVELTTSTQRSKARRLLRLLLDNGARPDFKARNERSAVILALDNPYNPLKVTDALLETEIWEQLNDERHMYCDAKGIWYSPLSYVEHVASPARAPQRQGLFGKFT